MSYLDYFMWKLSKCLLHIVGCFSNFSTDCDEDPEMDNRLYQQLSTGWTYRWQRFLEHVKGPTFMLEFSLFMLALLFLHKIIGWILNQDDLPWEYVHQNIHSYIEFIFNGGGLLLEGINSDTDISRYTLWCRTVCRSYS